MVVRPWCTGSVGQPTRLRPAPPQLRTVPGDICWDQPGSPGPAPALTVLAPEDAASGPTGSGAEVNAPVRLFRRGRRPSPSRTRRRSRRPCSPRWGRSCAPTVRPPDRCEVAARCTEQPAAARLVAASRPEASRAPLPSRTGTPRARRNDSNVLITWCSWREIRQLPGGAPEPRPNPAAAHPTQMTRHVRGLPLPSAPRRTDEITPRRGTPDPRRSASSRPGRRPFGHAGRAAGSGSRVPPPGGADLTAEAGIRNGLLVIFTR